MPGSTLQRAWALPVAICSALILAGLLLRICVPDMRTWVAAMYSTSMFFQGAARAAYLLKLPARTRVVVSQTIWLNKLLTVAVFVGYPSHAPNATLIFFRRGLWAVLGPVFTISGTVSADTWMSVAV